MGKFKRKYPFGITRKNKGWNFHMKRKAAKVAGATLGFIAADVPGAIYGYNGARIAYALKRRRDKAVKKAKKVIKKQRKPRTIRKSSMANTTGHNDLTVQNIGVVNLNKYPKKPDTNVQIQVINKSNFIINGGKPAMGVAGTTQGNQGVDFVDEIMHGNWLKATISDNRFNRSSLATDIYQFAHDHAYAYTGYQGEVGKVYAQQRMYIDSVECNYGFLSMTTVPQIVDVYFVVPKHDESINPRQAFLNAMAFEGNGMRAAQENADLAILDPDDGKVQAYNWGQNPFSQKEFRKMWRCVKKLTMTLNPGDQRHFKLLLNYKMFVDKNHFAQVRREDHLRNLTVTPLIIARAGLVGIRKAVETEAEEVAYGKAKVGVTTNMKINARACLVPRLTPLARIHEGLIINTTDIIQEIDDEDNVKPIEQN